MRLDENKNIYSTNLQADSSFGNVYVFVAKQVSPNLLLMYIKQQRNYEKR